jgi:hypothetical protein
MRNTFNFSFDELPLAIVNGIETGLINDEAEIEYYRDGEWCIEGITLQGFGARDANGKRTWPQVECPPVIAAIIDTRLNKEWHDRVSEAVNEQLASDREDAAEQRADYRRDARMES